MLLSEQIQIETAISKIHAGDWELITEQLHQHGFAKIEQVLSSAQCELLKQMYSQPERYRKTVEMQRYRFGLGEYKYFTYPLPNLIGRIRHELYPYLAPIANAWFRVLSLERSFPSSHAEFLQQCHQHGQTLATPLILKYGQGGFNTLHQDLYGEVYFPLQLVIVLSQPNVDFTGGELVFTQQNPRAQSKAMVMQPQQGDILIFTTQFKPEKGSQGYYRVNMKHGVSPVYQGERYSLGIIFHDALS
ncbi:2OG-Fe(II) oxygenase [Acinetobacter colistiniresistens]|uniref:2OG-Fe(II) oxygenase n=1 Tax=Acinetobacter colistiniresistens TaxID=280145 RepID=UPI00211C6003|nr:2OG-Fe(II) oxygenase [Acinetobacter colistiniresistens]UUM27715.1 2OG-Fe(II) oxygenase [Acinetobacter colistiniresistens]